MNYQIITDEPALRSFIQSLPPILDGEQYYVSLLARRKYCDNPTDVDNDKEALKRFLSTPDRLLTKIRQLECPIGSYTMDGTDTSKAIPQQALALYISASPCSLHKSVLGGISKLVDILKGGAGHRHMNPHAEIMSVIANTNGRKDWVVFDIDNNKSPETIMNINFALGGEIGCRRILETRGGYHVLVNPVLVPSHVQTTWHRHLSLLADKTGDLLIPVPGTHQGGFTPRFL